MPTTDPSQSPSGLPTERPSVAPIDIAFYLLSGLYLPKQDIESELASLLGPVTEVNEEDSSGGEFLVELTGILAPRATGCELARLTKIVPKIRWCAASPRGSALLDLTFAPC
eukprot:CAMPEP_0197436064 /NCGR_PEP_ID=MMETSP1175-20131217/3534_1 /TAXON_ID=1003142 /ORGANISM="Triceratium dubium, Strain CCMP147" /LENGTH=111 /DNA_ID=CAMNT_0042965247 /DNA_START=126 /DNA_END=461 /DNA_ORIENTATION=-